MSWPLFWVLFTTVALAVFGVGEGLALAGRRSGHTYSENIRHWLGVDRHPWYTRWAAWVFASVLVGFVVWFVPHILLTIWG